MSSYNFTKIVAVDRLMHEIRQSPIIIALDYITLNGDDLTIVFKADLPYTDQGLLSDLVTDHVATPLPTNDRTLVKPSAFADPEGRRARLYGTHFLTCAANSEVSQTYTLTADRLMDGAEYICSGGQLGDYVDFEVIHPTIGVVDAFCARWYVAEGRSLYKLYPAFIPAGLGIKVTYHNTGSNNAMMALNLMLHSV
jgi:hypothetical protein